MLSRMYERWAAAQGFTCKVRSVRWRPLCMTLCASPLLRAP